MYLSGVDFESMADGEGVRTVLFVSGCRHYCKGCHSPSTHDFNAGTKITDELIKYINSMTEARPFLSGLTLSGGDPMYSAKEILEILPSLYVPHKNIWCFTGFTFEQLLKDKDQRSLLEHIDILVDGEFKIDKRDVTLQFRGSSNQRIVDVQESLRTGKIVEWKGNSNYGY